MRVIKYLETRIDIDDITDVICADYNLMILEQLRKKYNGRCFKSVYILDILSIVRRGRILCKAKDLDGGMYVDIIFEASCQVYEKGEIIQKCQIIQIGDGGIFLAKSEHCFIKIK